MAQLASADQEIAMMKSFVLAGLMLGTVATASFADGGYWVVGNNETNSCEIATSNPVLNIAGPRYFASGPYQSMDDAKLARSTISQCPKLPEDKQPPTK
jgi:hypothetical protein